MNSSPQASPKQERQCVLGAKSINSGRGSPDFNHSSIRHQAKPVTLDKVIGLFVPPFSHLSNDEGNFGAYLTGYVCREQRALSLCFHCGVMYPQCSQPFSVYRFITGDRFVKSRDLCRRRQRARPRPPSKCPRVPFHASHPQPGAAAELVLRSLSGAFP